MGRSFQRTGSLCLCLLLLTLGGCQSSGFRAVAAPPAPPSMLEPTAWIPADLDVVVRVDLEQIRLALGASAMGNIRAQASPGDATLTGVDRALEHTRTAWFAFRPGGAPEAYDSVLILQGDFSEVELHRVAPKSWGRARDLGGPYRQYDRLGSVQRSQPVRAYASGSELLVFVSVAEVDSVERRLSSNANTQVALDPVAEGLLSFQLRPRALPALLPQRAPKLAGLLARTQTVQGRLNARAASLEGSLEATFSSESGALAAVVYVRQLLHAAAQRYPRWGDAFASVKAEAEGVRLVLSGRFDPVLTR